MKKLIFAVLLGVLSAAASFAQSTTESKPTQPKTITIAEAKPADAAPVKTPAKRGPVFRPTKDQIKQVQAMLKGKSLYNGEASGSYNEETRAAIRKYQKDNGLKATGTLNRATLEKMNVSLTDAQKEIPASESSYASAEKNKPARTEKSGPSDTDAKPKKPAVFRATSDQVKEAQRMLRSKSMYSGEETGKLDTATREGLKKFQEANGLKVTGTLNQATLESMNIALTEKQKGTAETQK